MQRWVRTFVAIEATGDICSRAVKLVDRLKSAPAKARWTDPPLHFTLKFLGDVEILQIPDVCQVVADAVEDLKAFDLEVRGVGAFPEPSRPRTVWIGTGRGTDEMVEVHRRLDDALGEAGFRTEGRRFRPHLTIGRVRNSPDGFDELAAAIDREADFSGGIMRVDELLIFSSRLERSGPVYEILGRAELV
jgi:2'-5' RNA ligase